MPLLFAFTLLLSLCWMFVGPNYRVVVPSHWSILLLPVVAAILVQQLLFLFPPKSHYPLLLFIRFGTALFYGPLALKLAAVEQSHSDWVVNRPWMQIRRLWSTEEMLTWVNVYHRLRPSLPRPPPELVEPLCSQTDGSLQTFKQLYIRLVELQAAVPQTTEETVLLSTALLLAVIAIYLLGKLLSPPILMDFFPLREPF